MNGAGERDMNISFSAVCSHRMNGVAFPKKAQQDIQDNDKKKYSQKVHLPVKYFILITLEQLGLDGQLLAHKPNLASNYIKCQQKHRSVFKNPHFKNSDHLFQS